MSIQTGVERQEESAARGLRGRLGGLVRRLRDDPNPLWIREMRQASRFQATPFALAGFTLIATLLVGMLAGLQTASSRAPATVGATLFHAFFSLAYFVVVLIGPALGANSIASERDGRTWEALLLTGLRPEVITRGKFLGAFTSIAMYVVALAPVSALPFIFGGVTPFEVLIAFVFLVLLALLAVAFGLATSARMESQRGAVVITLLAAVPIGGVLFSMFGLGGSSFAHSLWNGVRRGAPIWLPSAYGVAPFGLEFVLFLVLLPAACLGLPTWLLYEVTLANLTSVTEDRSFGLKRWHLVTSVALLALGCTLGAWHEADYPAERFGNLSLLLLVHALVATIMFSNETLGPSRRVERMLAGAGRLRRWLAPGVVPTVRLLRLTLSFTTVLVTALAVLFVPMTTVGRTASGMPYDPVVQRTLMVIVGSSFLCFGEFLIGLMVWLRARAIGNGGVRWLLIVTATACVIGPWVAAGILGLLGGTSKSGIWIAAPSPLFLRIVTFDELQSGAPLSSPMVVAPLVSALGYLVTGLGLASLGARRCRARIAEHHAMLADADRRLAEEDAHAKDGASLSPSAEPEGEAPTEASPGGAS